MINSTKQIVSPNAITAGFSGTTGLQQAVILAGGKGTRLRPLTYSIPKPMIRFHGIPFLEYLIKQVREQGLQRILLLLGYLPNVITDYFGDGTAFDVSIDYCITDVDCDTGMRLKFAKKQIDANFLLMYCDNYCPVNFSRMWDQFQEKEVTGQIAVYRNKDGYSNDNVRIDKSSRISFYDKKRVSDNLAGVEIGYGIFKREVLDYIPDENVNFEKAVYPILAEKRVLAAYQTDHRYYSVSNYERLRITEAFLKWHPAVIVDRDGVLNVKQPKACYVRKVEEFVWIAGSREAIRRLKDEGYLVIIVTNQAGIARGVMNKSDLEAIHENMKMDLVREGASIDAIYVCPHGWDEGCMCRKPKPGMLFQAQKDFHLDLTRTHFVGDDSRDMEAGEQAGCKTHLVSKGHQLLDVVRQEILCDDY